MFRENLYTFLKYLLIASIIYFILRYTPYINLDQNKALLTAVILVILCLVFEFLYNQISKNTNTLPEESFLEKFEDNSCDSCNSGNIEKFASNENQNANTNANANANYNTNCRLVCENDNNKQNKETTPENQLNLIPEPIKEIKQENMADIKPDDVDGIKKESKSIIDFTGRPEISRVPQFGLGYDSDNGFVGINCSPKSLNAQKQFEDYDNSWPKYRYGDKAPHQRDITMHANIYDDVPPYDDYNLLPVYPEYKNANSDYGYSYINSGKWNKTSLCTTDTRPPLNPNFTDAIPLDSEYYKY